MKNWNYTHSHDAMILTMHDCIVTQINLETTENDIRMTWHFPDGIWQVPSGVS